MLFATHLVVVRGGGDLGTGVVVRMRRAGFPVVVVELARPLTVRRAAALSSAVLDGAVEVDGVGARLVATAAEASEVAAGRAAVPVLVAPALPAFPSPVSVVVDARLAKRNIDTSIDDAPFVVGLGPGFTAGVDCHAVVETKRGHDLGRVIWSGAAAADTGIPGHVGGEAAHRVVRAPAGGRVEWVVAIGDTVAEGDLLGRVGTDPVVAGTGGVVRGLIAAGHDAVAGLKLGDIDPRGDRRSCFSVSDKSLAVGGGVLEAVLAWLNSTA